MDALWLCRAFSLTQDYSIFKLDSDLIHKMNVPLIRNCFSIYRSPATIGFAWDFLTLVSIAWKVYQTLQPFIIRPHFLYSLDDEPTENSSKDGGREKKPDPQSFFILQGIRSLVVMSEE
jgi:hypothetical protein